MGRLLTTGDTHGNYRGLLQALEKANFNKDDLLIHLGDIVDSRSGIEDAFALIEYLRKLSNLILIQANHDQWHLQWLTYGVHPSPHQGWEQTNTSYLNGTKDMDKEEYNETIKQHTIFFESAELYYIDNNRIFVHGGFDRDYLVKNLRHSNPTDFYWNRELWNQALSCHNIKLKTEDNFDEIYLGHTTTMCWKDKNGYINYPMNSGGVWNIDTGAGERLGKVSVIDVNSKEIWQSKTTKELYS